jgi:hypothetical protein
LRFIIDAMGRLPGRKSLVLMSDSMPRRMPGELEVERESDLPQFVNYDNYSHALNRVTEKAIRASVVIYSVDTQGLPVIGMTAADSIPGNLRQAPRPMWNLLSTRSYLLQSRREGAELLAKQTGGFQLRNSNSFQLDRIVEDQTGYYLIGYRPTEETFNRRFHQLKAKVKGSGLTLRTRSGFYGASEEEVARAVTPRDLTNLALMSPFAAQDIEVDLTSFFADTTESGPVVRSFVYFDVDDLTLKAVNGQQQGSIEIHGVIFGDNGSLVDKITRGATITLSEKQLENARRNGFGLTFDMPAKRAGSYQVRVAIRDRNSTKVGSAAEFVTVPNLKDKKLAVSGIILGTVGELSGQSNAASQPIENAGSTRFKTNSDLYYAYALYNAATNNGSELRNLSMQAKLFRDGKVVYTGPEVPIVAGDQKDLNRLLANGVVRLTPDFEPGNYYLQVLITDKDTKQKTAPVVQWVDFDIVQ